METVEKETNEMMIVYICTQPTSLSLDDLELRLSSILASMAKSKKPQFVFSKGGQFEMIQRPVYGLKFIRRINSKNNNDDVPIAEFAQLKPTPILRQYYCVDLSKHARLYVEPYESDNGDEVILENAVFVVSTQRMQEFKWLEDLLK